MRRDDLLTALASVPIVMFAATGRAQDGAGSTPALVTRMAKVGRASSPTFSPDGRRLAFVSDLSGIPQIWVMSTDGGWPTLVTTTPIPSAT